MNEVVSIATKVTGVKRTLYKDGSSYILKVFWLSIDGITWKFMREESFDNFTQAFDSIKESVNSIPEVFELHGIKLE